MDKRTYEGMFIVDSAIDAENNGASVLEEIKSELSRQEGEVVSVYPMGKRIFTFPIKKKRDGIYFIIYFDIDPQRLTKLKDRIKLNGNILRELIVTPYKVPYPEDLLNSYLPRPESSDTEASVSTESGETESTPEAASVAVPEVVEEAVKPEIPEVPSGTEEPVVSDTKESAEDAQSVEVEDKSENKEEEKKNPSVETTE